MGKIKNNVNCDKFVCRYLETCLVGVDCENGIGRNCRLNICEVCIFNKKCKDKEKAPV